MLGRAGEFGESENSVYGEKADIMFAGDETKGDSRAIVGDGSVDGSLEPPGGEECLIDICGAELCKPTLPSFDWE